MGNIEIQADVKCIVEAERGSGPNNQTLKRNVFNYRVKSTHQHMQSGPQKPAAVFKQALLPFYFSKA